MVQLRTRKREMRGYGGNHHQKLGLKIISCASQLTIPDTAETSPDPVCHHTDTRPSQPTLASRTPDYSYPLVFSTSFSSSSPISLFLVHNSTIIAEHKVKSSLSVLPWYISNNSSFRQKHPGVLDGSDGSDGTSYPLTENYTKPVAEETGRVAYVLLYFVVTFTHHQKDTCVTLFAGAAVMLKPFTQRLAMLNHSY